MAGETEVETEVEEGAAAPDAPRTPSPRDLAFAAITAKRRDQLRADGVEIPDEPTTDETVEPAATAPVEPAATETGEPATPLETTAAAEPDDKPAPNKVQVSVNGKTKWVTQEAIDAAGGANAYQMQAAAADKLRQAGEREKALEERERKVAEREQAPAPTRAVEPAAAAPAPADAPTLDEELDTVLSDAARRIAVGSEEDVKAALGDVVKAAAKKHPGMSSEMVQAELDRRRVNDQSQTAFSEFSTANADLLQNEDAAAAIHRRSRTEMVKDVGAAKLTLPNGQILTDELAMSLNDNLLAYCHTEAIRLGKGRHRGTIFVDAAKAVRDSLGLRGAEPATTATDTPALETRRDRKRSAAISTAPPSARRLASPSQPAPKFQSPSEYVQSLRVRRGHTLPPS